MNILSGVLPLLGAGSVIVAIITGAFMFSVNRAQAAKITAETQQIARTTAITEAEKALTMADRRCDALEKESGRFSKKLDERTLALENVLEAFDAIMAGVQPAVDEVVTITVTRDEMTAVRAAMRSARSHLN